MSQLLHINKPEGLDTFSQCGYQQNKCRNEDMDREHACEHSDSPPLGSALPWGASPTLSSHYHSHQPEIEVLWFNQLPQNLLQLFKILSWGWGHALRSSRRITYKIAVQRNSSNPSPQLKLQDETLDTIPSCGAHITWNTYVGMYCALCVRKSRND